jgi:hypothetical protein
MDFGPNLMRLRDSDVGPSLRARIVAGPADNLVWEVRVECDSDGLPVEVIGIGTDQEAAAAEAIRQLTEHSLCIFDQPEIGRAE